MQGEKPLTKSKETDNPPPFRISDGAANDTV